MPTTIPFRYSPIERISSSDPLLASKLAKGEPLVVTDCMVSKALANKWTVDYLSEHMEDDFLFNVFHSQNNIFQYWDEDKNKGRYQFTPPTSKSNMRFKEFVASIRKKKNNDTGQTQPSEGEQQGSGNEKEDKQAQQQIPGQGARRAEGDGAGKERYYLQQSLVVGVGDQILQDFKQVGWSVLSELQTACGFGELTTNLLLVGQDGNVTPLHFDEQQNFFCQLHGHKHIFVFPPSDWPNLYPYPVHHACDRQSQLPVCREPWPLGGVPLQGGEPLSLQGGEPWESAAFPNAHKARARHVCLGPGEMVYIPSYWWHHIVGAGESVSLTFWFKCGPAAPVAFPLNDTQRVALRRNLESVMGQLYPPSQLPQLMKALLADSLDKTQEGVVAEAEKMLRLLMASEETRPFLREMAAARFDIPTQSPLQP